MGNLPVGEGVVCFGWVHGSFKAEGQNTLSQKCCRLHFDLPSTILALSMNSYNMKVSNFKDTSFCITVSLAPLFVSLIHLLMFSAHGPRERERNCECKKKCSSNANMSANANEA